MKKANLEGVVLPGESAQQFDDVNQEALKGLPERLRRTVVRRVDRGEELSTVLSQLTEIDSENSDSGSRNNDTTFCTF